MPKLPQRLTSEQERQLLEFISARLARAENEAYLDANKAAVFDLLTKIPGGNFIALGAMIYRADVVSYEYSQDVDRLEVSLKIEKDIEKRDGRAKRIVKGCVKFEDMRP